MKTSLVQSVSKKRKFLPGEEAVVVSEEEQQPPRTAARRSSSNSYDDANTASASLLDMMMTDDSVFQEIFSRVDGQFDQLFQKTTTVGDDDVNNNNAEWRQKEPEEEKIVGQQQKTRKNDNVSYDNENLRDTFDNDFGDTDIVDINNSLLLETTSTQQQQKQSSAVQQVQEENEYGNYYDNHGYDSSSHNSSVSSLPPPLQPSSDYFAAAAAPPSPLPDADTKEPPTTTLASDDTTNTSSSAAATTTTAMTTTRPGYHEQHCYVCQTPLLVADHLYLPNPTFFRSAGKDATPRHRREQRSKEKIRQHCQSSHDSHFLWEVASRQDIVSDDDFLRHPDECAVLWILANTLLSDNFQRSVVDYQVPRGLPTLQYALIEWRTNIQSRGMNLLDGLLKRKVTKKLYATSSNETARRQGWVSQTAARFDPLIVRTYQVKQPPPPLQPQPQQQQQWPLDRAQITIWCNGLVEGLSPDDAKERFQSVLEDRLWLLTGDWEHLKPATAVPRSFGDDVRRGSAWKATDGSDHLRDFLDNPKAHFATWSLLIHTLIKVQPREEMKRLVGGSDNGLVVLQHALMEWRSLVASVGMQLLHERLQSDGNDDHTDGTEDRDVLKRFAWVCAASSRIDVVIEKAFRTTGDSRAIIEHAITKWPKILVCLLEPESARQCLEEVLQNWIQSMLGQEACTPLPSPSVIKWWEKSYYFGADSIGRSQKIDNASKSSASASNPLNDLAIKLASAEVLRITDTSWGDRGQTATTNTQRSRRGTSQAACFESLAASDEIWRAKSFGNMNASKEERVIVGAFHVGQSPAVTEPPIDTRSLPQVPQAELVNGDMTNRPTKTLPVEADAVDMATLRRRRRRQLLLVALISAVLVGAIATIVFFTIDPDPPFDPPVVDNDSCVNATVLDASNATVTVTGSTAFASEDEIVNSCGPTSSISGPSVWYEVIGTGARLQANACSDEFDVQVTVLSGSCDEIACVPGIVLEKETGSCRFRSWLSLPGERYFVVIHGREEGSFELSVSSRHDSCDSALPLDLDDTAFGTTVGADVTSLKTCSGDTGDQIGVWYVVNGTGLVLEATDCIFSPGFETDFVSAISVFSGTCGGNLTCVESHSDLFESEGVCQGLSLVQWPSLAGELYYIFVHGSGRNDTGTFGLQVRQLNDQCEQAAGPLEVNDLEPGSTALAKLSHVSCRGHRITGRGLWYSVLGTGQELVATTCTRANALNGDFDTDILVLRGRCGNFICEEGRKDGFSDCDTEASAVWSTADSALYYVFVFGAEVNATGSFALEIRPFVNDRCELATELPSADSIKEGSTLGARPDNATACEEASGSIVSSAWYRVEGMGQKAKLTVCATGPSESFSPQVSVLRGDCERSECEETEALASSESCVSVSWLNEYDQTYYIVVHGSGSQTGKFVLDLRFVPLFDFVGPAETITSLPTNMPQSTEVDPDDRGAASEPMSGASLKTNVMFSLVWAFCWYAVSEAMSR